MTPNQHILLLDAEFTALNNFISREKPSQIFFLVDENTHEHCLPVLLANLETVIHFEIIETEAGEENKNIDTAVQLWEILADFKADRKSLLINLGGGVITDMGGFVASTYKRGIPFINIPTTLLAMCDASLGGKTGIDHNYLKNIVGTFSLPEIVFLQPVFLTTLPENELRSGFAEMLKHGLIADAQHWKDLTALQEISVDYISALIERSMQIKLEITAQDFHEKNIRKTLNFGHTIGHAAESLFIKNDKPITHGVAVAMGMVCETVLSAMMNLLPDNEAGEIQNNILRYFPPLDISDFSDEDFLNIMRNDKKNSAGKISFSLLKSVGTSVFDQFCEEDLIKKALDFYRKLK